MSRMGGARMEMRIAALKKVATNDVCDPIPECLICALFLALEKMHRKTNGEQWGDERITYTCGIIASLL